MCRLGQLLQPARGVEVLQDLPGLSQGKFISPPANPVEQRRGQQRPGFQVTEDVLRLSLQPPGRLGVAPGVRQLGAQPSSSGPDQR